MDVALDFIRQHADHAPWLIFGLFMLAGLNIPVSEDALIFLSALLAATRPDLLWPLYIAMFSGAYLSDVVCYGLGRQLGPAIWESRRFRKMVKRERVTQMQQFYAKYGAATLFVGRFIPFGVRNALFLTAGMSHMHALKFLLADLAAATISCNVYFWLYYVYGTRVVGWVKDGNLFIFVAAMIVATAFFGRRWYLDRKTRVD